MLALGPNFSQLATGDRRAGSSWIYSTVNLRYMFGRLASEPGGRKGIGKSGNDGSFPWVVSHGLSKVVGVSRMRSSTISRGIDVLTSLQPSTSWGSQTGDEQQVTLCFPFSGHPCFLFVINGTGTRKMSSTQTKRQELGDRCSRFLFASFPQEGT